MQVAHLEEEKEHLKFVVSLLDEEPLVKDIEGNRQPVESGPLETRNKRPNPAHRPEDVSDPRLSRLLGFRGDRPCPQIRALHNYVIKFLGDSEPGKALLVCQLVLEELAGKFGKRHPSLPSVLAILALVHSAQGDLDSAVGVLDEGRDILEAVWGPGHPGVLELVRTLGHVYEDYQAAVKHKDEQWRDEPAATARA